MAKRTAEIERETKETTVRLMIDLDGEGKAAISTGVGFFDHMLDLLARHAYFDMTLTAEGDTAVDDHHTVEDVGICLGQALKQALGDKQGIYRFGSASVPMDEARADVSVDLSGRPYLVYQTCELPEKIGTFDTQLVGEFLQAPTHGGVNLHVSVPCGENGHHIIEAVFKALAKALAQAIRLEDREKGVPSTKGML
ncbi:MAG: imidazoleglycerol-phosphate dehydratase [Planctomycetes bacterium SM23_65]|nr:MAG: imidazoleglycerol-phosphate dehydratase [Planctomycetes bacterium SM23_65]